MANQQPQIPKASQWPIEKVIPMFGHALRWKILMALAERGPQTASALPGAQTRTGLHSVLKQLGVLRKAGWITMNENPGDGRKCLYALTPALDVVKTETGADMRFGYCTFHLRSNGMGK